MRVYLGLFAGVPNKRQSVEGHLLYVAYAAEHFFVVGYEKKKNINIFISEKNEMFPAFCRQV